MMKKLLSIFLSVCLLMTCAGCGASGAVDAETFAAPSPQYGMLRLIHNLNKLYGQDVLEKYIDTTLTAKGYAGIVTNFPASNGYLEAARFWDILTEQVGWLAGKGARVWIYDEYGYPSGGAGTLTLAGNPEYEALAVVRVTAASEKGKVSIPLPATHSVPFAAYAYKGTGDADRDAATRLEVTDSIGKDGALQWETPDDGAWFVETFGTKPLYDDTHAEGNASQDRRYINVLDKDAVEKFRDVTYQAYYDHFGPELFESVEAFFTDEPSLIHMYLGDFGSNVPVIDEPNPDFVRWPQLAWLDELPALFEARFGYGLLDNLTALFTGTDEAASRVRYDYWTLIAALYEDSYFGTLGDWCDEHDVLFSGHLLAEETLNGQVISEGNVFANYSHMTLPGCDMLSASPEQVMAQAMTPKLAASAAHLDNRAGVMSESSEYTLKDASGNLTISIEEVRCSLALQYALGVTQLTSYFSYNDLSPDGEEDGALTGTMLERLGQTLDGGRHVADVALYYPYETLFAELIPTTENWNEPRTDRVGAACDSFAGAFNALLAKNLDLDILPDTAFLDGTAADGVFTTRAGESFRVIVVPTLSMLPTATIARLAEIADAGVPIVFLPQTDLTTPTGEDTAAAAEAWSALQALGVTASDAPDAAAKALEAIGTPDLAAEVTGGQTFTDLSTNGLVYKHVAFDDHDIYLLVHPSAAEYAATLTLRTSGTARLLDPLTGEIRPCSSRSADGTLTLDLTLGGYGYTLLEITH